jgi:hypothetical protein
MEKPLLHAIAETYTFAWTHKKSFFALFREWFLAGLGVIVLAVCIGGLLAITLPATLTTSLTDYQNLPLPLLGILVLSLITLIILMSGFLLVGIVRCHRLYILGELDTQWRWGWRGHEWLYAKRMFASFFWIMLWCIPLFAVLMPLLLTPLLLLFGISLATASVFVKTLIVLPIQIATLYLVSRYCLSLVGGAVGEFISLKESVRLTAPHRWRITYHSLLLIFPPYILGELLNATGWNVLSYISGFLVSILSIALGAFVYSHYYVKLKGTSIKPFIGMSGEKE